MISAPARIGALGMYAPEKILANADFESMVQTSDEWIVQRTGIRTRHVVSEGQYASHMAFGAIEDLLANNPQLTLDEIDYMIVGSSTADYEYPNLPAMIQEHFGLAKTVGALQISVACAAFTYGINLACGLIATGQARKVLVMSADALTRSVDYTDRATCVLFGDGAGCAVVEYSERPAIFGMDAGSDGSGGKFLYRTGVRSEINGVVDTTRLLHQDGKHVYRWVMENVPSCIERVLQRAGTTLDEIDWFLPHSANLRMIEALDKRINFPIERTLTSVEDYGNTSAVSMPFALVPAVRSGKVKKGDRLLLIGFGGGLVMAGNVIDWT